MRNMKIAAGLIIAVVLAVGLPSCQVARLGENAVVGAGDAANIKARHMFEAGAPIDAIPPKGKPCSEYQYIFPGGSLNPEELVSDMEGAARVSRASEDDISYEPGWQDTAPPTADVKNLWTYVGKPVQPTAFVHNIQDASPVTIKYKTQPDFSVAGMQTVHVIIEDAYGNAAEFAAQLSVVRDIAPPVISGELDKRVAEGGTLSYRAGVSVTDDYDKNVQLIIDSSQVNLNQPGVYTVIYSATDESGNRAEERGYVTVFEINMALVNEMADGILAKIIPPGMGALEKARAIYAWVYGKMKYAAANTERDIAHRAYACFTKGSGDCYTYMAASHVLLTRAGIDNRIVQRIPEATSPHYWNLVNAGTGWRHFDTCPSPTGAVGFDERFMFTESQAREYTETITARDHYYDYDKSTVPEAVE